MGSQVESTHGKEAAGGPGEVAAGRAGGPTFADKQGETTEKRDRPRNPGLQLWEIKPQTYD